MKLRKLLITLGPLWFVSTGFSANIIDSIYGIGAGDFELPDPNFNTFFQTFSQGSTAITGWTVGSANLDWVSVAVWNASSGGFSIDLNGTVANNDPPAVGSIKTLIPTTIGTTYTVNFDITSFVNFNSPTPLKEINVSIKGVNPQSVETPVSDTLFGYNAVVHNEPLPFGLTWETRSLTFTATQAQTSVSFNSLNTTDHSAMLLDKVVIEATTPVPEPATPLMLLAGAACLGLRRRRGKQARVPRLPLNPPPRPCGRVRR